ncbi:hypothetical protein GCM10008955_00950 [Deinococcus malanensis]|uniref:Uncharacterized protein n=1 Tax=Deinococcus malanensis TaxID=1706855 RepID=A0ABQ2EGD3_9DEIO|nr:hypothetical protein GCM10008955_00950 [Deinococcus malanensis]
MLPPVHIVMVAGSEVPGENLGVIAHEYLARDGNEQAPPKLGTDTGPPEL